MLADSFPLKFEWQRISLSLQGFLNILTDFNNAVVWMVYSCPLPLPLPLVWELFQAPQLQLVSQFSSKVKVLISFPLSFIFTLYHSYLLGVFHISITWWSFTGVLNDKSQVTRTLLSIQAIIGNKRTSGDHPNYCITKSTSPFINPLMIEPRAPITIGINVTFIFRVFFFKFRYLSFFTLSFNFTLWSAGIEKSTILQVLFLFFC